MVKIDFPYDANFFKKYYELRTLIFPLGEKRGEETEYQTCLRAAAQILFLKANNKTIGAFSSSPANSLRRDIIAWGRTPTAESFADFYSSNKEVINRLLVSPPDLRFLLRASPKKIDSSNFDFFGTL